MPTETNTETTESPEATTDATEVTEPTATVDDEPLGDAGKRALEAERKARKDAEARLKDFEAAEKARRESEMTELEKAQAELASLKEQSEANALKALRAEIAAETGVPAGLLSGSDEDSMRESAQALLAFKGTAPKAPSPQGQGNVGDKVSNGVKQLTREDLKGMSAEDIVTAQEAGQMNNLLGIK